MQSLALRDHPFARTLTDGQVADLLPCAHEARFVENAFIFREGGAADTLYLVCSGCVALEQHVPGMGAVQVESLCDGDILGLSWLFPDARWTLDARAVSPVESIAIRADCLRDRMDGDQALGLSLLRHVVHALYQRLIRVRLQRLDVYKAGA